MHRRRARDSPAPARPEAWLTESRDDWFDQPMSSGQSPLGERVFLSADVSRIAGVSLRQLQWWDERKLVTPQMEGRRRAYTTGQVLEILTVAALRRKGLSLQKIRKVLRLLRRELAQHRPAPWTTSSRLYLLTNGKTIFVHDQVEVVLDRLAQANKPMYLVSLSDNVRRIMSDSSLRRYRTSQLPLFDKAPRPDRNAAANHH